MGVKDHYKWYIESEGIVNISINYMYYRNNIIRKLKIWFVHVKVVLYYLQ